MTANSATQIKICGLTCEEDVSYINKYKPEFIGIVLYFPKSKRNLSIESASKLISLISPEIKKVAVTVSPTLSQAIIIEETGFDYIQIHGQLEPDILTKTSIPIIRAINVDNVDSLSDYQENDRIHGFLFDAAAPGSGKTFDWSLLGSIPRNENKLFILAGGLNADNVLEGIKSLHPDLVDTSSSVEYADRSGKDPEKIENFINTVRRI